MVKLNDGPLRAYFGDTYFKKAIDTRLIVDGAIEASQISAGAITADAVGTNEIIANLANISQAVIDDLSVGSISAGDITTGTIDSAVFNLSGTGGQIKSNNFVAGSAGFQILGNGTAEFSDVTVRGGIESSTLRTSSIIIDDSVYLYRSNALSKPATPTVSRSTAGTINSGTIKWHNTNSVDFRGYNATGGTTANRVLSTTSQNYVLSIRVYAEAGVNFYSIDGPVELQHSTNGTSWSTFATVPTIRVPLGGNAASVNLNYSGVQAYTLTSTSKRYFRARFYGKFTNGYMEYAINVSTQNWL
jgi:hypothetical protein